MTIPRQNGILFIMNELFLPYLEKIETYLTKALPEQAEAQWKENSFANIFSSVTSAHIQPLLNPTHELLSLGGKRWRPLLLVLLSEAVLEEQNISEEQKQNSLENAFSITPLVEFVHTASLIHDDIEDCSDTRRGKPAAYITYGLDSALNAGSWLYFEAPVCIDKGNFSTEQKLTLYKTYTNELRRLHLGQAMDITWHNDNTNCPTAEEYIAMVRCKTGTLASLATRTGILCAGGSEEMAQKASLAVSKIGAGFQIIDDYINLTTGNAGKKRGDDIVEGKKSLPVLLYNEKNKSDEKALSELSECFIEARKDGIDSAYVEKAISLLDQSGVIREAKTKGIYFIDEGLKELAQLFSKENKSLNKIITLFNDMVPKDIK